MMLIILDKNPYYAAKLIPEKLKFKQLIEIAQLICSTEISIVYKKMFQGKELQNWIKNNPYWVLEYFSTLLNWAFKNIKLNYKTYEKLSLIERDLKHYCCDVNVEQVSTAVFRYKKDYKNTKYNTNSEIPIDLAIDEYKKYIEWKING